MSNNYVDNKRLTKELGDWARHVRGQIKAGEKPYPLTDYIAECVFLICNNMGYKSSFINYCVDGETEALTKRGWLMWDEIKESDCILSYYAGRLIWSSIKEIFINKNYIGEMFRLSHKNVDALVTPEHKFISEQDGIKEIEMFKSDDKFVLTGNYEDGESINNYSDEFIELIGWIITEGSYSYGLNKHSIVINQKEGKNSDNIRKILNNLKCHYKEYVWHKENEIIGWRLTGDIVNDIMNIAPNKQLTYEFIFSLSQYQRMKLIKTMIDGGGWIRSNEGTAWSYTQNNKEHIDKFVILCTLSGLSTGTKFVQNKSSFSNKPYYVVNIYKNPKKYCKFEHIDLHGGKSKAGGLNGKENHMNKPTQPYNGVVWCPTTEYGTWICRRNDKVYVTGNTYKEDMIGDAIENCVRYIKNFDNEKNSNAFGYVSTIAYYAFVRRIKKENKRHIDHLVYVRTTFAEDDIRNALDADNPNDIKSYTTYVDHMQSILDDMNIVLPDIPKRKKKVRAETNVEKSMVGDKY